MFTSEELGIERLNVGDYVYRFDWDKPITGQLCMGKVSRLVLTETIPEGYMVKSIFDYGQFDENKVYSRMEIEKAPKEETWAIKKHIQDLKDFAVKRYYRDQE